MSMVFSSILAAHRRSVTTLIFLALFSLTHAQTPWDGSPDTDWYTSNPSATEYTINTAEELAGLAIIVNNTAGLGATVPFTDKTITLGNNIVLNDVTNWENWATTAPENTWERIGNSSTNIFKGTFDGNGKTISGVYVNSATFEGLFGWLDGTIKDLNVTNSYIKGTTSVGGLVGRINAGSRVINCSFSGNVEGGENTGGLVGLVFANNAVVNQSRSSGSVTGTASSVGGLVGQNGGQIYNSYSSAKVSSTSNQVGGLVGRHAGGASVNIYNSFATGEVTGIDSVGGFVGAAFANTGIANSYSTGRVTATKTVPIATGGFAGFGSGTATLHNCFYDTDKSGQNDKTGKGQGKTTAQMQTQDFVNNLNSFAGIIPIPATQAVEISIKKWNYSTGNYPSFSNENASAVEIKDFFARGTGTVSDPYIINRREHLVNLSMLVSLQIVFRDEYIKLETDIELNDNSADNWENYSSIPPANAWIPIGNNTGTNAKTFNGTFDGNFHTISGVYINVQNTPASGMGLFGNIGTFGTVKNLGLINSYIRVNDTYIGGIAGDNLGTIENCYSNAWVAGNGWLGGIAGRVNGANGKILNSYFGGTVELTGGTSGNAGGLTGGNSATPQTNITNSYSAGKILITAGTATNIGAIAGNGSQIAITNSYFDRDLVSQNALGTGSNINANAAQYTEDLRLQSAIFDAWDFDDIWSFDPKKNNGYPNLLGFTYAIDPRDREDICFERGEGYSEDKSNCIKLPQEELKTACEESGRVWCLVLDRCRSKVDWYDGKSVPYTISDASGLSWLEYLVSEGIDDFEDKIIKLGEDIELSENWTPIGTNAGRPFKGIFDGQGYTISGLSVEATTFAGLFGYITDGQVKNVNIIASQVSVAWSGVSYAGILAAFYNSDKAIDNVFVSGSVLGQGGTSSLDTDASYVGGLVGRTNKDDLQITNSRVAGDILSPTSGQGTGGGGIRLGGLVGFAYGENLLIEKCYANVNTSGVAQYAGGLIGEAYGAVAVKNSYASGNISGANSSAFVGGLIAYAEDDVEIENSYFGGNLTCNNCFTELGAIIGRASGDVTASSVYYDVSLGGAIGSPNGDVAGISAVNTSQLKTKSTFEDWDFNNTWGISNIINNGYPYLLWNERLLCADAGHQYVTGVCKTEEQLDKEVCEVTEGKVWENGNCATPIRLPQIATAPISIHTTSNAILLQNLPINAKVEVYNLHGKRIYASSGRGKKSFALTIPIQTKGIYIVKIDNVNAMRVMVK